MRTMLARLRYGRWLGSLLAIAAITIGLVIGWRLMSPSKTGASSTPAVTGHQAQPATKLPVKEVGLNQSVQRFVKIYFSYNASTEPTLYRQQLAALATPQFMRSGQVTLDRNSLKKIQRQQLAQTASTTSRLIGETYRHAHQLHAAGRVGFSLTRYKNKQILWSSDNFSAFMEWVKTDQGWRITRLKL